MDRLSLHRKIETNLYVDYLINFDGNPIHPLEHCDSGGIQNRFQTE